VDEADFEALYAKHARYVAGVVHRLMGNDGELDDIVQETFVDAIEGLSRLVDSSATRAWLVTVAVRRTRRVLARRRCRMMFAFWSADFGPRSSDPRDRAAVDDLYDALARVPEDLRIPWVLPPSRRASQSPRDGGGVRGLARHREAPHRRRRGAPRVPARSRSLESERRRHVSAHLDQRIASSRARERLTRRGALVVGGAGLLVVLLLRVASSAPAELPSTSTSTSTSASSEVVAACATGDGGYARD